jgi:hypothetical protein
LSKTCINPTEIHDGDLMAYVDGTADETVVQHIRRCPACARQAGQLAALQAALTAKLYRFSCPTSDQLIAYQQGELRGSEKLTVAQHLRQCPHCARELAALARDKRVGLGERVRSAIEVLKAVLVTPQVQATGVRGIPEAAHPTPQVYRAGEIEIIVSQRPCRTHPRRWYLSGLVHVGGRVPETITTSASRADHGFPPARNQVFRKKPGFSHGGARVELYRGEGLVAITTVSSRGRFTFTAVEPADYDISLVWGNREVQLKGVQVK